MNLYGITDGFCIEMKIGIEEFIPIKEFEI
jgi:hypothetical protein